MRVAFPAPGDPLGLYGVGAFTSSAIVAQCAVVMDGGTRLGRESGRRQAPVIVVVSCDSGSDSASTAAASALTWSAVSSSYAVKPVSSEPY